VSFGHHSHPVLIHFDGGSSLAMLDPEWIEPLMTDASSPQSCFMPLTSAGGCTGSLRGRTIVDILHPFDTGAVGLADTLPLADLGA